MDEPKMLDGICHPRWSVWLNWMLILESYENTYKESEVGVVHGCCRSWSSGRDEIHESLDKQGT